MSREAWLKSRAFGAESVVGPARSGTAAVGKVQGGVTACSGEHSAWAFSKAHLWAHGLLGQESLSPNYIACW